MVGMGGGSLLKERIGEKKDEEIEKVANSAEMDQSARAQAARQECTRFHTFRFDWQGFES